MKYLINFSILFIGLTVPGQINAQVIETFYDLSWKPCEPSNAAYYSTVQKTDSGWLRNDYYTGTKTLQMQALFSDKECTISNGSYKYFHANGRASALGKSLNDKKEGVCVGYHTNGLMKDSAFYQKGEIVDKKFFWHPNGYMSDSISRMNDSVFVHVGWHDDGAIAFAGRMLYGKENGIWKYYHRNG